MTRRLIAVFGATGNQGGSVAKLLLHHSDMYRVRAVTRNPDCEAVRILQAKGAEIVRADLTVPSTLSTALAGCWGIFLVTNFYDDKIKDDPGSEEQQGKNLIDAAIGAGTIECLLWSTLPSSKVISGGRFVSRIYEGKYHVDEYIRKKNVPACFLYTGNFYENMILRSHIKYNSANDTIEFHQPVIRSDTKLAMLFVEKDLAGIVKAVFDQWDVDKVRLYHKYLYCADARISPDEIISCVERISGKKGLYIRLEKTGWPDRDAMFDLYNEYGMYGAKEIPDEDVLALGVELHSVDDFVREKLLPHLGLPVVEG